MQGSCLLSLANFCASKTKLPYPCKVEVLSQRALSFDLYLCVERDCTELSQTATDVLQKNQGAIGSVTPPKRIEANVLLA